MSLTKTYNFVKIYLYFNKNKTDILKDHKPKKSGIYMLYNRINNHFYIGSSINISGRMKNYLNTKFLKLKRNANMPISKALLKYGYDNFSLIIIEYSPECYLMVKESFWIKSLKPYYNVLTDAYRSTGYKHTEEIKKKMRIKAMGRLHSNFTKKLISNSLKGDKNPFFNKKHSLSSKILISEGRSNRKIYIYDNLLNLQIIVSSLNKLAKSIYANNSTLNTYIKSNKLFRGNWYIKDYLVSTNDIPLVFNNFSIEYKNIIEDMRNKAHIKQAIFVFELKSKKFIQKFDGIIIAEKKLNIHHEKIKHSIINNKPLNGYIFSYHRLLDMDLTLK